MLRGSRVFDCIIFFNELELLEIRLHELDEVVDTFVIVEATQTHQGEPKPSYFGRNKPMFERFLPKIRHIAIQFPDKLELPVVTDQKSQVSMAREKYQRNAVTQGLHDCAPNDIVILCDADEIPSANSVMNYAPEFGRCTLPMDSFYYWMNMKVGTWTHAKIISGEELAKTTPDTARQYDCSRTVTGAPGWHYSYMGGPEKIIQKFESFSHVDYSHIPKAAGEKTTVQEMKDHLHDVYATIGKPGTVRQWHNTYPEYVQNNLEKYRAMDFIR